MSYALSSKEAGCATSALPDESLPGNAWDLLDAPTGTIEGPEDWAEQYEHYAYGTPKQL